MSARPEIGDDAPRRVQRFSKDKSPETPRSGYDGKRAHEPDAGCISPDRDDETLRASFTSEMQTILTRPTAESAGETF